MEHPSETKQHYDEFFRIWSYGREKYTIQELAKDWDEYQMRQGVVTSPTIGSNISPRRRVSSKKSKSPEKSPQLSKQQTSPKKRSPPVEGVCSVPTSRNYLNGIDSGLNIASEGKGDVILALLRKDGLVGNIVELKFSDKFEYVKIQRTIYTINNAYSVQGRIDPQLRGVVSNNDAFVLLNTHFKPLLESYAPTAATKPNNRSIVANVDWALRVYAARGCSIAAARASARRDIVQEMSFLLGEEEDTILQLLKTPEPLLTPEKRARMELYLLVKRGTQGEAHREVEDPIDGLRWLYVTKLKGHL